ncbi:MAG TPA: zinc dependent phospholipase C family protein [Oscillatoriaceae cyanobacterium]
MRASVLCLTALVLGTLARPAGAWGIYTHALIAERAYGVLVPKEPWLAAHREAFLWGAVGPDLDRVAEMRARRTHSPELADTLWSLSSRSGDDDARAFALGWAASVGSDQVSQTLDGAAHQLRGMAGVPHGVPDAALIAWTADSALMGLSDHTLNDLFDATVAIAVSPAAGAVRQLLSATLGIDEVTYRAWTDRIASMSQQGPDQYLHQDADWLGVRPYVPVLRTANARVALGRPEDLLGRAVDAGVSASRQLLAQIPHNPRLPGYESKNAHPERKKP